MKDDRRGAAVCVEILKAARMRWRTTDELASDVGVGDRSVRCWVTELTAQGILRDRVGEKRGVHGIRPREFKLSSQWGGL